MKLVYKMLVKCLLNLYSLLSLLPVVKTLTLNDVLCDEKGNVREDSPLCLPSNYTRLQVSNLSGAVHELPVRGKLGLQEDQSEATKSGALADGACNTWCYRRTAPVRTGDVICT